MDDIDKRNFKNHLYVYIIEGGRDEYRYISTEPMSQKMMQTYAGRDVRCTIKMPNERLDDAINRALCSKPNNKLASLHLPSRTPTIPK